MSVYMHMCVYLHACPLKSKHSSNEHTNEENGDYMCVYIYMRSLYIEYKGQNTLENTTHILHSAYKSNAKIRICFIPLPYF